MIQLSGTDIEIARRMYETYAIVTYKKGVQIRCADHTEGKRSYGIYKCFK